MHASSTLDLNARLSEDDKKTACRDLVLDLHVLPAVSQGKLLLNGFTLKYSKKIPMLRCRKPFHNISSHIPPPHVQLDSARQLTEGIAALQVSSFSWEVRQAVALPEQKYDAMIHSFPSEQIGPEHHSMIPSVIAARSRYERCPHGP